MQIGNAFSGCPLNNLIPEWNDLIFKGCWEQAYNRLKITNNFPEFTSRVCPALCEKACTCGANGDAVTVKANEYGIIENAYEQGLAEANPPKVRTGKKIAIIGSGPSGLAAADQLNQRGHSVTVFERSDRVKNCLTNTTELYSAAAHPTQEILRLKAEKLKAFTLLLIFLNQLLKHCLTTA